jgi:O-acetylhomoserine (thiol)-lyase
VAIFSLCEAGDHIVSSGRLYGGTYDQIRLFPCPNWASNGAFVDPTDPADLGRAIRRRRPKIFYGETLGNPDIKVFPFEEVAALAKAYRGHCAHDRQHAGNPYLCRPIEFRNPMWSPHSTTKFLAGHGQAIGGALIDGGNFDWTSGAVRQFRYP